MTACCGCGCDALPHCAGCVVAAISGTLELDSSAARTVAAALLPDLFAEPPPDADRLRHRLRALLKPRTDTRTPGLFS